jgi:hypothetical protein
MTTLPLPAKLPMWELCNFKITRPELRAMLGEPHFVETDSTRTYGGDEDAWAYTLPSGQRVVVVLRVPYHIAVFSADPPELDPFLEALHIQSDDPRLVRYPQPVAVT